MTDTTSLTDAFLEGRLELVRFRHADHVQVGFELLKRCDFPNAAAMFSATQKRMATQAGVANAYHETISVAFLALIAERSALHPEFDFTSFRAANADLFEKSVLGHWYSPERLRTDMARRTFILPDARS